MGSLWVDGSRACQMCGATVVDALRSVHEEFHLRVDPILIEKPEEVVIDSEVAPVEDIASVVIPLEDQDAEPKKPKRDK